MSSIFDFHLEEVGPFPLPLARVFDDQTSLTPPGIVVLPAGIASTTAFGAPGVIGLFVPTISPAGIDSEEAFGVAEAVRFGPGFIEPLGIDSEEAFGTAGVVPTYPDSIYQLLFSGIDSTTAFGIPEVAIPEATFARLISEARGILADRRSVLRYDDTDLMDYANDALAILCNIAPALFALTIDHPCSEGAVQQLSRPTTVGISVIYGLRQTSRELMDRIDPDWMSALPCIPRHWIPHENDPRRFYVVPPAPAGHKLKVSISSAPPRYLITDPFPILRTFWPAVVDYVVGMAEARDDDHVLAERAAQFIAKARTLMGAGNG